MAVHLPEEQRRDDWQSSKDGRANSLFQCHHGGKEDLSDDNTPDEYLRQERPSASSAIKLGTVNKKTISSPQWGAVQEIQQRKGSHERRSGGEGDDAKKYDTRINVDAVRYGASGASANDATSTALPSDASEKEGVYLKHVLEGQGHGSSDDDPVNPRRRYLRGDGTSNLDENLSDAIGDLSLIDGVEDHGHQRRTSESSANHEPPIVAKRRLLGDCNGRGIATKVGNGLEHDGA